jgi:ribosomal subunit interface protein
MIIEISARNLTISPASRKLIAAYNSQLTKYFKRIYSIRWVFETVRTGVKARLQIHAFSGNYRAGAGGKTMREVIVSACDSIEKQRRRRKRISERARRLSRKVPSKLARALSYEDESRSSDEFEI